MKHVTIMLMIYTIFSMFFTEDAGAGVAQVRYVVLQLVTKSGAAINFALRNEVLRGVGTGYIGNELYNLIHPPKHDELHNKHDELYGFVLPTQPSQPLYTLPNSISVESTSDLSSVLSKHLTDKDSNPPITKLGNIYCVDLKLGKLHCYNNYDEQTRTRINLLADKLLRVRKH